jgi:flagellar biosynthesis protein FlhG
VNGAASHWREQAGVSRGAVDLAPAPPPASEGPTVVVLGSGKGGVGKSILSVLLGAAAAAQGRRVLLFDADHNLGNLHVLLGVRPAARLEALIQGELTPNELLCQVAERLWLMPGDSGTESLHALETLDRARLHRRLSEVYDQFDTVIVDTAAGIDGVVRSTTMQASRLVVVTAPEPTALTDAYALMKIVHLHSPGLPIDVLVNRCVELDEGRAAYDRLAMACERFLKRGIRYLGAIAEDPAIRAAVCDPAHCLALLQSSGAARTLREWVVDRMELPVPRRSVG